MSSVNSSPQHPSELDFATYRAIEALVTEHAYLLDHGFADQIGELYVESGRLLGLSQVGIADELVGREAISNWARRRAANTALTTRHVCTNLRVTPVDTIRVNASCYITVYRAPSPEQCSAAVTAELIAEYLDELVYTDSGQWRFQERRVSPAFIGPGLLELVATKNNEELML